MAAARVIATDGGPTAAGVGRSQPSTGERIARRRYIGGRAIHYSASVTSQAGRRSAARSEDSIRRRSADLPSSGGANCAVYYDMMKLLAPCASDTKTGSATVLCGH